MDGVYAVALPQAAAQLIGVLNAAGHAAYAVGGCVRDSLLGRTPKDWDISVSYTHLDNTLTVNVNRLRKKLEAAGLVDCIETKKGLGYRIDD